MAWLNNIRGDFNAHGRDWLRQGFWVMCVYRFGRGRYGLRPGWLRKPFSLVYKMLYKGVQILTGIELPCEAVVGRNFRIDHFGCIIVSGYAETEDVKEALRLGAGRFLKKPLMIPELALAMHEVLRQGDSRPSPAERSGGEGSTPPGPIPPS